MARPPRKCAGQDPHGPEPITESLIKLLLWLAGPPRRTGAMLARACGYSQQRLSYILCRYSRPAPDSELAQLIAIVTEGHVPPEGWLMPEERRVREARRARAAELGRRLADDACAPRQGRRRHAPDLGEVGTKLGLASTASSESAPARVSRVGRRGVSRFAPDMAEGVVPAVAASASIGTSLSSPGESAHGGAARPLADVHTAALVTELANRVQRPGAGDAASDGASQ